MAENYLTAIRNFFGYETLKDFRADWGNLTDADKKQLRAGIESGTLSY